MAQGFFNNKYAPKGYRAVSAGTRPASQINPVAIRVMKEAGIDLELSSS
jgi:protein-tyrosine-phosphatase